MAPWKRGILAIAAIVVLGLVTVALAVRAAKPMVTNAPGTTATEKSLITWMNFKEGSELAMKESRPIMMDFATTWCEWCQKLDAETYRAPEVVELAKKFVCIRVDGDKEAELTAKFKVEGFPTIVFADYKGEEKARITGYAPAGEFAKEMKEGLK